MKTMEWKEGALVLLDQTRLPLEIDYTECRSAADVANAIRTMQVRGAPAIGAAAAYGLVLAGLEYTGTDRQEFINKIRTASEMLASTRPTAVNLFWALKRMVSRVERETPADVSWLRQILLGEAHAILQEDIEMNRRMGRFGSELIPYGASILTHCNAGALATGGYGTALGVIRAAHEAGKDIRVYADETRPLLQGARLTAWELMEDSIPVTLITDNMAGYVMKKGLVSLAIVGADRIAANGDVANKIGTYTVAVLCKEHRLPFYVAAPGSTIDLSLRSGEEIPIEERAPHEVTGLYGREVAPRGVKVFNPAFDVTPNELVTAIITDRGVVRPPYEENLGKMFKR